MKKIKELSRAERLSLAAKKAAATRRKNKEAIAAKWSEAGRKAWATRKANELARKRSEAGKKAAATRRKNAVKA